MTILNVGASIIVAFPIGAETGADAYLAFCEGVNPDPAPGAVWYPADAIDAYGRRIVNAMVPGNAGVEALVEGEDQARIAGGGVLEIGIAREVDPET